MSPIKTAIIKLKKNFQHFLGIGLKEVRPISERMLFTRVSAGIAFAATFIFSIINYYHQHFELAAIELAISFFILLPVILLGNRWDFINIAENLLVLYGFIVTLALVSYQGVAGTGILWIFGFPFLIFLLKGQRDGWLINLIWIFTMFIGISQFSQLTGSATYDGAYAPQTYLALIFYCLLAATFNMIRAQFEALLHEKVQVNTQKAQESLHQLEYLATHDPDTNLVNLGYLYSAIDEIIESENHGQSSPIAVIMLKLSRFSEISNILGEDGAIKLLLSVTDSLQDHIQDKAIIAHERHDEFILVRQPDQDESIQQSIDLLLDGLTLTFRIQGFDVHFEFKIGAARYPDNADNASELLNKAELALLDAITRHTCQSIYDKNQEQLFVRKHLLFGQLRQALLDDEIFCFYQPKYDLNSRQIIGAEALARWQDKQGNFISPEEFIPIAENSGLIYAFTNSIIRKGFAQQAAWQNNNIHIKLSLNLSVHNLLDKNLIPMLKELLRQYQLKAQSFVLEITESSFADFRQELLETLIKLHEIGFGLSIDDFGTGYSSLSYLGELPATELKIDQSFIRKLFLDKRNEALVKSIIDISHNMDMYLVAEGIEDAKTEQWLANAGCEIGQGFGYSKPLSATDFEAFFAIQNS